MCRYRKLEGRFWWLVHFTNHQNRPSGFPLFRYTLETIFRSPNMIKWNVLQSITHKGGEKLLALMYKNT